MDNSNNITVMVVEDEKVLIDAITRKLQATGHKVLAFISGREALAYLQQNSVLPDVIWLDYYLGDFNGMEFVSSLKKDPKLADIPIVVVSNSASQQKISDMKKLGVDDYVLKAENKLDDLVNLVTKISHEKKVQ